MRRRLECDGERRLSGIGHVCDTVGMRTTFAFNFVKSEGELSGNKDIHLAQTKARGWMHLFLAQGLNLLSEDHRKASRKVGLHAVFSSRI